MTQHQNEIEETVKTKHRHRRIEVVNTLRMTFYQQLRRNRKQRVPQTIEEDVSRRI